MKLLAIDTATEACSAALLSGGDMVEEYELAPKRHAELILPMVDRLLARAGLGLSDLDALAFGRGPGAFTGLRIATGVAQGLAFAAGLPVIPVSTLAALALSGGEAPGRLCAIDARMGEIYWCTYTLNADGLPSAAAPERVSGPGEVSVSGPGPWFGLGSGWASYADRLKAGLGDAYAGHRGDCYPRARHIAAIARREFEAGRSLPPEQAIPVYLRDRVTG
ncbi:MAG: tRNA (adenosine(37)-N6)-threonylcarbamoyltransferase complex dimerization subunit type 1 TsaB, partial [Gammaproteobacteria bacterium]